MGLQVDPVKYPSIPVGFKTTLAEDGAKGLAKGWAPTLLGYSFQGVGKFGFYEVFKILYGNAMGEEAAYLYRTQLYLAASASAEFFADMFLSPFEAMKVRIQTMPGYANNMREAYAKMSKEGGNPFYKGLKPLWLRQIPYTMMKFAALKKLLKLFTQYGQNLELNALNPSNLSLHLWLVTSLVCSALSYLTQPIASYPY